MSGTRIYSSVLISLTLLATSLAEPQAITPTSMISNPITNVVIPLAPTGQQTEPATVKGFNIEPVLVDASDLGLSPSLRGQLPVRDPGEPPPDIIVNPLALESQLNTGESEDRIVNITNDGEGALNFTTTIVTISEPGRDANERRLRGVGHRGPVRDDLEDLHVLLIMNGDGWSPSNRPVAGQLGIDYDQINSGQIGDVDFEDYTTIITHDNQGDDYYNAIRQNIGRLEEFCANGGELIYQAASNAGTRSLIPGRVEDDHAGTDTYNVIHGEVDRENPLLAGNPDDADDDLRDRLWGSSVSHWAFPRAALEDNNEIDDLQIFYVTENNRDRVTLATYSYGRGSVCVTTFTQSAAWGWWQPNDNGGTAHWFCRNQFLWADWVNTAGWVSWAPEEGVIEGGSQIEMTVTLNAEGLIEGDYEADLHILSDDGNNPDVAINITLSVIAAPDINVIWDEELGYPNAVNWNAQYPDLFTGSSYDMTVTVVNEGVERLAVDRIEFVGDFFRTAAGGFSLAPGEENEITISLDADESGVNEANMIFVSNDPAPARYLVPLHGETGNPPVMDIEPEMIEEELFTGGHSEQIINVTNNGEAPLRFALDVDLISQPGRDENGRELRSVDGSAGPVRDNAGQVLAQFAWQGGEGQNQHKSGIAYDPDHELLFVTGYDRNILGILDPTNNYAVVRQWNNPGPGNPMDAAYLDGVFYYMTLWTNSLFRYDVEGNRMDNLNMGNIQPTAVAASAKMGLLFIMDNSGGGLPPFPPGDRNIYVWDVENNRAIGSINNYRPMIENVDCRNLLWVDKHDDGQLWCGSSGGRLMELAINTDTWRAVRRVQNFVVQGAQNGQPWEGAGHDGHNLICGFHGNQNYMIVDDGVAEMYWMALDPEEGEIGGGGDMDVAVTFDAFGLVEGNYEADIHILTNDPDSPDVAVNVLLVVLAAPDITVEWSEENGFPDVVDWNLAHEELYSGGPYNMVIELTNNGSEDLQIGSITADHEFFTADPSEFTIGWHESANVTLTFNAPADAPGNYTQTLTIASDDPDERVYEITLHAQASLPPVMTIEPEQIQDRLFTGGLNEHIINVTNDGEAPLTFSIDTEIIAVPERDASARTLRGVDGTAGPQRDNPGQELGTFTWDGGEVQNEYKAGIAYDFDNNLLFLTGQNRNIFAIVDPADNYRVVRQWNNPGNGNPMDAAWLDGAFYDVQLWNNALFRWDVNGNRMDPLNLPFQVRAVAASQDLGVLFCLNNQDINQIVVIDPANGQQIGVINNWRQFMDNRDCYSILWVDKHPAGQLWVHGWDAQIYEIAVNPANWQATGRVQQFQFPNRQNPQPWDGIGWDGHNLIIGQYGSPNYQIVDDGITEMYWLLVEPDEGQLEGGADMDIFVTLDGANLVGGDYVADLHFLSNDPARSDFALPVVLHVTGAADVVVEWPEEFGFPDILDWNAAYPDFFTGSPYNMTIVVSNHGTARLAVADIFADHEFFSAAPAAFNLQPGEEREVVVTFEAPANAPDEYIQTLTVQSNDPDENEFAVRLHADSKLPPVIDIDPNRIEDNLFTGGLSEHVLNVSNFGDAPLRFTIEHEIISEPGRDASDRTLRGVDGVAGPQRDNPGEVLGQFAWEGGEGQNQHKSGVAYDFDNDLIFLTGYDRNIFAIVDPADNYRVVRQWNNPGNGNPMTATWLNGVFYDVQLWNNALFRWDVNGNRLDPLNLNYQVRGVASSPEMGLLFFTHNNDLSRMIVFDPANNREVGVIDNYRQYIDNRDCYSILWVDKHDGGQLWVNGWDAGLFQIGVNTDNWQATGRVQQFQFPNRQNPQPWDAMGWDGHNLILGQYGPANYMIVDDGIEERYWLNYEPKEGELDSGLDMDIFVTLDAEGLLEGDYEAELDFLSNDPNNDRAVVNVLLHVTGASDITVEWPENQGFPDVLDWNRAYQDLFSGGPYTMVVTVSNDGTADLNIEEISFDNIYFSSDLANLALQPGQSREVTITFNAPANRPGDYNQILSFFSDDPDEEEFQVALHANAGLPPSIATDPNSIDQALFTDEISEVALGIANDGQAELRFTIDHEIISEPGRDSDSRTLRDVDGSSGPVRDNPGDLLRRINVPVNTFGGMAFDGELMWGCSYGNARMIAVDPANGQVVADFNMGMNSMSLAWDGEKLWASPWAGNQVFTYDRQGQRLGTYNFNFGAFGGMGSDLERGYIFVNSINDRRIHVIRIDNQQEVASFDPRNAWQGADVYAIEWVTDHPDGQLWGCASGRLWEVFVDDNWNCQAVQNFAIEADVQHAEMANDGENMWHVGRWGEQQWRVYDDGVREIHWLAYEPDEGTLAGGSDMVVIVTLDATGLVGGDYIAELHFLSNDPAQRDLVVDVHLEVTGAPVLVAEWSEAAGFPEIINWNPVFPDLFTANPYDITVTILNDGTADLVVEDVSCDNQYFLSIPDNFSLAPGDEREITFRLNSQENGIQEGTMVFTSNLPGGDYNIPVRGETNPPPIIVLDVDGFEEDLFTGGLVEKTINVTNDGGAPLRFEIESEILAEPQRDQNERELRTVDGFAGPQRDNPGDVLAQFNWNRSNQGQYKSGIAYDFDNDVMLLTSYSPNWVAIMNPENHQIIREWQPQFNPMGACWLNGVFYVIPWANNFLGRYDVEGNDLGRFNTNNHLPTAIAASQELQRFLILDESNNRDMFVLTPEWQDVARIGRDQWQQHVQGNWSRSIQWIDKHSDGQLWINTPGRAWELAVDIDNWRITGLVQNFGTGGDQEWDGIGHDGHNLWIGRYNSPNFQIVDDGIREVYWLAWDPEEGEVAGGSEMDVFVTLNAVGLIGGDYEADLHFLSNDPNNRDAAVNILIHVTEAADLTVEWPENYGFPDVLDWNRAYQDFYSGGPYDMVFKLLNDGTGDLVVNDISADLEYFTAVPTEFRLGPGATRDITVTFDAPANRPGDYNQTLTISSDDPDEAEFNIALHANASLPPVIDVEPSEIEEDLFTGGIAEPVLSVSNSGQAELRFTIEHNIISEPERDASARTLRGVDGTAGPQRDNPGQELGTFTWDGGEVQNEYKAGIAYDFDNNLLFLTGQNRNIFAIVDPADNYRVVRQWNNPGNGNPMDAAWLDGAFYDVQLWNNALFRWDVNGNRMDPLNLPFQVRAVAASQDLGVLFCLNNQDINQIVVIDPANGQQIGVINNWRQFMDNRDCYSILWVDKHPAGQLWVHGWDAQIYEIAVNPANWQATGRVQQFQFPNRQNPQPWDGIGWDGHNLIIGQYGSPNYQIVDDGITEIYWIGYEPREGTLEGGANMDVFVTLDATDLIGGNYEAEMHFLSNDPANPNLAINILLHVTGAPDIALEWSDDYGFPEVIDWNRAYQDFYSGGPYEMTVKVTNDGTADLNVEDIAFDHEFFSAAPPDFSLQAGQSRDLIVTFNAPADAPGEYDQIMTLFSDDPDEASLEVALHANATLPPTIVVNPNEIEDALTTGEIVQHSLNVANVGNAQLRYIVEHEIISEPERDRNSRSLRGVDGNSGPQRDNAGDLIRRINVPWNTSSGMAFDGELMWGCDYGNARLIAVDPTNDQVVANFAYGVNSMSLAWDGEKFWVSPWAGNQIFTFDRNGQRIGTYNFNFGALGGMGSDLKRGYILVNCINDRRIHVIRIDNQEEVASFDPRGAWQNADVYGIEWVVEHPDGQLWGHSSGRLWEVFVDDNWNCQPVQNFAVESNGAPHIEMANDGENMWVGGNWGEQAWRVYDDGITEVRWLAYEPKEGELEGGTSMDLTVTLNATGLFGGDYEAEIRLLSNDPATPTLVVNVLLQVTAAPMIAVEWPEQAGFPVINWNRVFPTLFTGGPYRIPVTVKNEGTDILVIDDISCDNDFFSADPANFEVAPGEEGVTDFIIDARANGLHLGTMTIFSDDPHHGEYQIEVRGRTSAPPEMDLQPNSIDEDLFTGGSVDNVVTITNRGSARLIWETDLEIISEPDRDQNYRDLRKVDGSAGPQRDNPGDLIGQFNWNRSQQSQYKAGIAWDPDNEMMLLTCYSTNFMAIVDPANNYQTVREWQPPTNPMGATWLDGIFYVIGWTGGNQFLYRWDIDGNNLGNFDTQGIVPTSVAASPDLGVLLVGDGNNNRDIFVYNVDRQRIGTIGRDNYMQYTGGQWQRSLCWIDKHPDGQLWINTPGRAWEVSVDTDNWRVTSTVQNLASGSDQEWDGIGHDAHNLIIGRYNSPSYQIMDDGITEMFWLMWDPPEGQLSAGRQQNMVIGLNAAGLIEGNYEADLHFLSNDPANPDQVVNVVLQVTGAPDVTVEWPDDYGFPNVLDWNRAYRDFYSGGPYDMVIEVTNDGTADLNVDDISIDQQFFSANPSNFVLQPDASRQVTITFNAPANRPGDYNQTLVISSDDPDEAEFEMALHANASLPPILDVDPNVIEDALLTDEISEHILSVTNDGTARLRFTIEHEVINEPERDRHSRALRGVDGNPGPARDNAGDLIRRINVPYNTYGGMAFDGELMWGSDYGTGHLIAVDPATDQVVHNFQINGSPMSLAWDGEKFWASQWANNIIFLYDREGRALGQFNLNFAVFGGLGSDQEDYVYINCINDRRIHVINIGDHAEVASFDPRGAWQGADVYGIEWVVDHPDGQLWGHSPGRLWEVFVDENWNCNAVQNFAVESNGAPHIEMANDGENMWVGGNWGEQVWRVYDDGVDEMRWLRYTPEEGVLDQNEGMEISVILNATALIGGNYEADLHFLSNDPAGPDHVVNVVLEVTGSPVIEAVWPGPAGFPDMVNWNNVFQQLYTGGPYRIPITIRNEGTDVLIVDDITCNDGSFSADPASFEVPIGERVITNFILNAQADGLHEGVMTIFSNDPHNGEMGISVQGRTTAPPVMVIDPGLIEEDMFTGAVTEPVINITNQGVAQLEWDTDLEIIREPERDNNQRALRMVDGESGPIRDNAGDLIRRINVPWNTFGGMAFDGELMWGCDYGNARLIAVDPSNDQVVQNFAYGVNSMSLAWDGEKLWVSQWAGNQVFTYDRNGQRVDTYNFNFGALGGMGSDLDQGYIFINCINDRRIHVIRIDNQQEVASFDPRQAWQNADVYGIEWVAEHPDGQLWGHSSGRLWEVFVDENWNCQPVQNFAVESNGAPHIEMANDGENMWVGGNWGEQVWRVYDDGVTEMRWIRYEPKDGVLAQNADTDVVVTLNATGLIEGDYEADLHFLSNDPANADEAINIIVHVTAASDILAEWPEEFGFPDRLDWNQAYEELFSGGPYPMTIVVNNNGVENLRVQNITSNHNYFSVAPTNFMLAPEASREVIVTFNAAANDPGDYNQILTISSDDPDEGQFRISMHANADLPPIMAINPDHIEDGLVTDEVAEHIVNVANAGDAPLRFTIEHEIISEPDRDASDRTLRGVDGLAGPQRDNPGEVLGQFAWEGGEGQNQHKSGVAYDFDNDLIFLTGYDRNIFAIVDPADNYRVVRQWNNPGNGNPMTATWLNGVFYDVQLWNNALFRWDVDGNRLDPLNLNYQVRGVASSPEMGLLFFTHNNDLSRMIVFDPANNREVGVIDNYRQYIDNRDCYSILWVDKHDGGQLWVNGWDAGLFQIGVNTDNWQATGRVQQFQFPNRQNPQPWDAMGWDGHNLILGQYGPANYMIVDDGIEEVYWIGYSPKEGTVQGDGDMDVTVTLSATDLIEGDYIADMHFLSNDPAHRDEVVRIQLHVTGIPIILVRWAGDIGYPDMINWNAAYPQLFTGGPYRIPITVINDGTAVLSIDNITCDNQVFSADPTAFEIPPGEEAVTEFILNAAENGLHEGTVTISSNDPNNREFQIAVRGRTSTSPIMDIDPLEIGADLASGEVTERVINISNTGGARLRWRTEVEIIQEPGRDMDARSLRSVDGVEAGPQRDNPGDVLGHFTWNRAGQQNYKAGIAWDPDNELMFLTCYSTNWMALVDPADNYRVVQEWQPQAPQHMGATWLNGVFYTISWTGGNAYLLKYDIGGRYLGNFITPGVIGTSVTASPELEVLLVGDGGGNRDIYVYNPGGDRIATIARDNYQQYIQGQWQRSLCWVDKHPDGQLWINTPGRAWQVSVDTDNWRVTGTVQNFGNGGDQEWDGIGHDGDNIWIGRYNSPEYQIVDDGVQELFWLRWEPELGEIAAGADQDVVVTLNATDLIGGVYEGNIHFLSNDPSHWDVAVNAIINVTGAPVLETEPIAQPMENAPDLLSFETTYVGGVRAIPVTISNVGTEVLVISRVTSSNAAEFNTDADDGITINAREEAIVNLLFHPTDIDDRAGRITFFSDAANLGAGEEAGQFWFDLVGRGQTPPNIVTDPDDDSWIRVGLAVGGDPVNQQLVIRNQGDQGGDDLEWNIIAEEIEPQRDAPNRSLRSVLGNIVGPRRDPPESRYALFKEAGGWGDQMEEMWQQEGVQITQYNSNQFGNAPIEDYQVIWIREFQSDQFNQLWNQNRARFEEWVDAGGVLYQGTATNNWGVAPVSVGDLTRNAQTYSNQGIVEVTNNPDAENYNYLAELCNWQGGEGLSGNSWCHSSFNRGDLGRIDNSDWYQVIARFNENQNLAGIVAYNYGRGYAVITGTTDSHQYANWRQQGMWGWALPKVIWYLDFLANQGPNWLEVNPEDGTLAIGQEENVTLTFDSQRLEPDTNYYADLMIESNDPDQPLVVIHLLLRTGSIDPVHFVNVEETADNHSLLVTGITFDGDPVPAGWEIGAFTPDGVLAGSAVWEDAETGMAAWGANDDHPDYFEGGETINLRLWDNEANEEWEGTPRVEEGDMVWQSNGFTVLAIESFRARTQEVPFRLGWNLISINITPTDQALYNGDPGPEIVPMMAQLRRPNNGDHHLILMKNERGLFYVPSRNFNGIHYWNISEGYQVRLDTAMSARWTGISVGAQADVPIGRGWNIIAYSPDYPLDASRAGGLYVLSPILDRVIIAKDWQGAFMIPSRNFSNMQPWHAGLGYQINVNQETVLNYPVARDQAASIVVDPESQAKGHWADLPSTGANMSILITKVVGVELNASDQVAAFNASGRLIGVGCVTDGQIGVAVWGDDPSTKTVDGLIENEAFTLRLWSAENEAEFELGANVQEGSMTYTTDGFTVIDATVETAIPTEYYLSQNYPNPFNAVTRIAFGLPEATRLTISVFDVAGREVTTLVNGEMKAGHHNVVWSAESLVSGVYIVKMKASNFSAIRKVMLVK